MCDLKRCSVGKTVFSADCTIGMVYGEVVGVKLFIFVQFLVCPKKGRFIILTWFFALSGFFFFFCVPFFFLFPGRRLPVLHP